MTTDINKVFRFRNFKIYKKLRPFVINVKKLSKENFPSDERFALSSQLWRALDSIILNIAEGSDRSTDKDFAHFLNLSKTSLNEVVACLDVALDNNYIDKINHSRFLQEAAELSQQLTAFRLWLKNNKTK